ncbi:MAG: hypothetical protein ACXWJ5_15775 [Xanthobacteraceae bacterium]
MCTSLKIQAVNSLTGKAARAACRYLQEAREQSEKQAPYSATLCISLLLGFGFAVKLFA